MSEEYNDEQRLHYFLSRLIELEEVWGLANADGWLLLENNEQWNLPLWPSEILARRYRQGKWEDHDTHSISLEHCLDQLLPLMSSKSIDARLLPSPTHAGLILSADSLMEIMQASIDAGEYYMEG